MPENTVGDLFELAIAAELGAQEIYQLMEQMFHHDPDAAKFWKRYAAEEAGHASWLITLRNRLPPEKLAEPADPLVLENARRLLEHSANELLGKIRNLDDAYQLATEMEGGETNAVFEFLIDHFSDDPNTPAFLRAQLHGHISRLSLDLPVQYRGKMNREKIKAAPIDDLNP